MEGTDETRAVKPFASWLQEQRLGVLHAELSEELGELVRACRETGKAGKVILEVGIKPNKDGTSVTVTDAVKVKLPEGERGESIFYYDDDGVLSRRDPRQPALPVRPAPEPAAPPAPALPAAAGAGVTS